MLADATAQSRPSRTGAVEALPGRVRRVRRFLAGRDLPTLLQLMSHGLFQSSLSASAAGTVKELLPTAGLTTTFAGRDCLVIGTFTFRGLLKVDLVPIFAREGPKGCTHAFKHSDIENCDARQILDTRFFYRVVAIGRTQTGLVGLPAQLGEVPSDVHRELTRAMRLVGPLASNPNSPTPAVDDNLVANVLSAKRPVQVKPRAAVEHARTHQHHVMPRGRLHGVSCELTEGVGNLGHVASRDRCAAMALQDMSVSP